MIRTTQNLQQQKTCTDDSPVNRIAEAMCVLAHSGQTCDRAALELHGIESTLLTDDNVRLARDEATRRSARPLEAA